MAGRTDVKISVIVPVYNVEKELPRCIESLLTQTYSNFELLLINDGSSDGSPEIMERYAEKDPRIRTLHKKNGGVSSARNRGLEQAKGEYVCFVDADDVVASYYLEWLCRAIQESRLPLAICKQVDFEEKETDPFCDLPTEMPALKTHKIENYTFWDENVCTRCVRGMMRADLVRDIRYDEQIAIGEDALFMVQALLRTKGVRLCALCTLCLLHPAGFSDSSERLFTKTIQRNNYLGKICALVERQPGSMSRTAEERFVVACAHVYYRMAGSDHADPELQAKIVRMAREHWRAALRVPNSKKREKSKLWMLICCPAAGRWMWRLGKS